MMNFSRILCRSLYKFSCFLRIKLENLPILMSQYDLNYIYDRWTSTSVEGREFDFTFNLSLSRLAAVWIACGYSLKTTLSFPLSGRFYQAPHPSISDYSVSQTQGDTLEFVWQDVTGSGRLNVRTLESPTVIHNGTSGRFNCDPSHDSEYVIPEETNCMVTHI